MNGITITTSSWHPGAEVHPAPDGATGAAATPTGGAGGAVDPWSTTAERDAAGGVSLDAWAPVGGPASWTPEAIVAMLKERLSDLDQQIDLRTAALQSKAALSDRLTEQLQAYEAIRGAIAAKSSKRDKDFSLEQLSVQWKGRTLTAKELLEEVGLRGEVSVKVDDSHIRWDEFTVGEVEGGPRAYFEKLSQKGRDLLIADLGSEGAALQWIGQHTIPELKDASHAPGKGAIYSKRTPSALEALDSDVIHRHASGTEWKINLGSLEAAIEKKNHELKQLNNDKELLMIQLQSLIQQRAQSVSLATSMLSTMNDSLREVARNV
ncbi:MAG: hypothetical protein KC543_01710 [Myxococcales bacterium]|nr:hypothetical protein [Myxococcales bacterium]